MGGMELPKFMDLRMNEWVMTAESQHVSVTKQFGNYGGRFLV